MCSLHTVVFLFHVAVQDGGAPYPSIKSNPEVIKLVCTEAKVHPHPRGCSARVYTELAKCWGFEPSQRPKFADLKTFFELLILDGGAEAAGGAGSPTAMAGEQDSGGAYNIAGDAQPPGDTGAYNITGECTHHAEGSVPALRCAFFLHCCCLDQPD